MPGQVEALALAVILPSVPLLLAALGGYMSEKSGVVNIALEGMMLASCCGVALGSLKTGSPYIGLAIGLGVSTILGAIHWLLTQRYRIDAIISGMGLNAIVLGGCNYLSQKLISPNDPDKIAILPLWVYVGLAFLMPLAISRFAAHTRGGLRMQAAGSDPDKSRLAGLNPAGIRLWALMGSGLLCGLSGAFIVSNSGRYVDNMTAGRGYIALAALIVGGWRPVPAALACLLFGALDALQLQLQGQGQLGSAIPPEIWTCLPYAATVIAMAGLMGKNRAPAGLGKL